MRVLAHALVVALVSLTACGGDEVEEAADLGQPSADTTGAVAAGGTTDTAAAGATSVSGASVYSANCATCHGESGRGDGPASVGLEPPPADLSDGAWVTGDGSLAAIVNVVANGSPGTAMIGWRGTLSDAEIDAVARHVLAMSQ